VSVPRPALLQSSVKLALQQVHYIFAQDGKELPAVERPSSSEKQAIAMWMRTDDKILVWRDSIPELPSTFTLLFVVRASELGVPAYSVRLDFHAFNFFSKDALHD
jgi:hypothetical protein